MIKVTDRFYIDANTNCYVLKEKTIVSDKDSKNYGQEVYKDLGYYTNLESCLKGILKTATRTFGRRKKMNWKDELMQEMGYTICPICFPEYTYCNEDCEHCKEYNEFKQFYEGKEKKQNVSRMV